MNTKTKKIFARLILALFVLLILVGFIMPQTGRPIPEVKDLNYIRQLSIALFAYANDNRGYPDQMEAILNKKYIEDSPYLRDVIRRTTYIKPPQNKTEAKHVMLILPLKGGVAVSYSDLDTVFIREKKSLTSASSQ
ncbi:MAG: hypothetical protein PHD76_07445 [Methylacidiphilales bacterium]|nr:hypothetical protein [Candidatus Methylacidiphilales bacterium]